MLIIRVPFRVVSSEELRAGEKSVLWHGEGNIHQLDVDEDTQILDLILNDYDFQTRKMTTFIVDEEDNLVVADVLGS